MASVNVPTCSQVSSPIQVGRTWDPNPKTPTSLHHSRSLSLPGGFSSARRLHAPFLQGVNAAPQPQGGYLNDIAANYSAAKSFCGGSQAICLAHSLSLPPASSQMAAAPTAPKPAAKHTIFPQMAFRCNYVLSIQNLWSAKHKSQPNINGILILK